MRLLLAWTTAAVCTLTSGAQEITPVDVDDKKPDQPRLHYYDKHGNQLAEPVYFLLETDTVAKSSPRSPWPLFNGVSVGINFFDAAMLAAGQSYSNFDIHADVSLHNWFFPVLEVGLGTVDNHPEDANFRYKGKPNLYVKLGLNYNFLYKSNPDYQCYVGVRGGWSRFRYDVTDIQIGSSYWEETNRFSLPGQRSWALYGEALAGLKVKLWRDIALGWTFRYHFKFKVKDAADSTPWFIPGYGANSPIAFTFSLIYTIGARHKIFNP